MANVTGHRYVITDDQIHGGEPILEGTRTPVRAVVEVWRLGTQPEEIAMHFPHLSLAQVFDALSYYSDHQDDINAHIERHRANDTDSPSESGAGCSSTCISTRT